jgi:hypothetical protein
LEAVLMEKIVDLANSFTDRDMNWWPILFLRPDQNEKMTNALVGKLAVFYGLTGGISLYLLLKYLGRLSGLLDMVTLSIVFVVGVFIFYRVTFAVCWNYRAERLQAMEESPQV